MSSASHLIYENKKGMVDRVKNMYEVRGKTTVVFVRHKGQVLEVLIDTEDLPKMHAYKYTWQANWSKHGKTFYIRGYTREKRIAFHRYIMDAPDDLVVDHINHNTLDNRKSNLRVVTFQENSLNKRARIRSNSKIKWIHWDKNKQKWQIRYRNSEGKRIYAGLYDNIDEAKSVLNIITDKYKVTI